MLPSPCSLDEARAANPEFGYALYAFEPGGAVTLEIMTPKGDLFRFDADSEAAALALAFPTEPEPEPAPPPSIFD